MQATARNNDSWPSPVECEATGDRGIFGDGSASNPPSDAATGRPRYTGTVPTFLYYPSVTPPNAGAPSDFFSFVPHAYVGLGPQEGAIAMGNDAGAGRRLSVVDHVIDQGIAHSDFLVASLTANPISVSALAHHVSVILGGIPVYIYVIHADPNMFNVMQSLDWIRSHHPDQHRRIEASRAIELLTPLERDMWVAVGPLSPDQVLEAHVATPTTDPECDFRRQHLQIVTNEAYVGGNYRYMQASDQLLTE